MSELSAVCQRKSLLGKSIITLDDASKAGTVNEVWVDPQSRRVSALGCLIKGRTTIVAVPFDRIQVLGEDAILIGSITALVDLVPEAQTRFVDHELVTEGGKRLGQVDDYYFERVSGQITNCLISGGGLAGLLEGHTSLDGGELLTIGKERSIVKAGAEERQTQVDKGMQQWIELGRTKVQETAATLRERMAKREEVPVLSEPVPLETAPDNEPV
ncbi:PRC-barrel domain-containing protein [Candidatus Cyanaurora vandensis]|uniref:PRC-barrel domain-containing protein n=1 Tax=Candidatus Cyanaurora vandensis TaxID=2714958 RepID=UPI00258012DF|nr:PRC-barrel domain-containing protein [Candidatus Cyanaurora vandensis]